MNELFANIKIDTKHIILLLFAGIAFKLYNIYSASIIVHVYELYYATNETSITIPQHCHAITVYTSSGPKENKKMIFSNRFHALNHYILKHLPEDVNNTIEVMKKNSYNYHDYEKEDFILLPKHNQKIEVCKVRKIFFEIIIQENIEHDKDTNNTNQHNKTQIQNSKNYIYRISKKESPTKGESYKELECFLNQCVDEYEKDKTVIETPIYEYVKTEKISETDSYELVYKEYPFKSNKHLDENIFFENKGKFIEFIDRFSKTTTPENKKKYDEIYKRQGITKKAGILLYGPPGCGKSCTIRGILNRTGRIGVLMRWPMFSTCGEFAHAFRSGKIFGKKYELRDLCFIIEDFDANHNEVLKKRSSADISEVLQKILLDVKKNPNKDTDDDNETAKSEKNGFVSMSEAIMMDKHIETFRTMIKPSKDELTLDCVLNVLDGIIELEDAMFIFTTNHVEKIDSAFMRPGRIDYVLELTYATVKTIREMLEHKYSDISIGSAYDHYFDKMKSGIVTPAEIQDIYLKYDSDEIEKCLEKILEKMNKTN